MLGVRPARCVPQRRIGEADFCAATVQSVSKRFLAPRERLSDDHTCIIAALHDDPLQEIVHRYACAHLHEHPRATHAPGSLADRQCFVQGEVPCLDLLEGHERRHQLAHGSGRYGLVRALLEQHIATSIIDQDRGPCRRLEILRRSATDRKDGHNKESHDVQHVSSSSLIRSVGTDVLVNPALSGGALPS